MQGFYAPRREVPWMSELPPYFAGPPFHGGFHEPRPYLEESYEPYSPYAHPHPSMVLRIPRTVSAMPAFGPYTDSPYMGELGPRTPLRSSSAIPPYPYSDISFHDVPRGPARSASSIPSFRESRPKHHKVAPVRIFSLLSLLSDHFLLPVPSLILSFVAISGN